MRAVRRLANRSNQGNVSTVVRTAQDASQVEPTVTRDGLIALVLGVMLGFAGVAVREGLDDSVRSPEDISRRLGLPLLGLIPPVPSGADPTETEVAGSYMEAYGHLRIAVEMAATAAGARTIMVCSALEQEGKSTVVANLAMSAARAGQRVLVVDMDLRRPTLHRLFGIERDVGVAEVVGGTVPLESALIDVPIGDVGLYQTSGTELATRDDPKSGLIRILTAGQPTRVIGSSLSSPVFGEVVSAVSRLADLVLVDTPPLLPVSDAMAVAQFTHGTLVVVRASVATRKALSEAARLIEGCANVKLGVVVTDTKSHVATYGYSGYTQAHTATPDRRKRRRQRPSGSQVSTTAERSSSAVQRPPVRWSDITQRDG
jgi:Mrp family chromosome partitioning ATPase